MLISYGMSIVGTSHISKGTPCQDAHRFRTLANGWIAAAVADGVGSSAHSEIASKIACDTFIEMCTEMISGELQMSQSEDTVLNIMIKAYKKADFNIKEYADKNGDSITDYDTTLSAVIYDGQMMVYGHSGDGGIVALTFDGDYVKVTEPQKADDGVCVIPLRAGEEYWDFGIFKTKTASVLLATDGVYDNFMPYLLRGQPVEFYIPLIRWFMDNNVIGITEENRQTVEESRKKFLCGSGCQSITDDKTVLTIFNADIMPELKEDAYYAEPNWTVLQEEWNRKAYPHLYKDEKAESDVSRQ